MLLYVSSYEIIKSICTDHHDGHQNQHQHTNQEAHVGHDTLSPMQAMLAGGVATILRDFVMTPMDTMQQRMQLGHYDNLRHAFASIVWGDARADVSPSSSSASGTAASSGDGMLKATACEGWKGLYRSFPIIVIMRCTCRTIS